MNNNNITITLRLNILQFFINELPWLLLLPALLYVYIFIPFWGTDGVLTVTVFLTFFLFYKFMYMRSILFIISDQQLMSSHGFFTNSTDYIELYRIIDYQEHRSLLQNMVGLKTVTIISSDRTSPVLHIKGLSNNVNIITVLRTRSEINKKRMGVYEIANR